MALAGMVLNIILNLVLIPYLFARGAAIASLVTQSATAFIQVMLCFKIFSIKFNYRLLVKYITFISLSFLIGWGISITSLSWISGVVAAACSMFIISLVIRLIDLKSLRLILKSEN
jgi:O-antigen/teichoic acid export membrane protein